MAPVVCRSLSAKELYVGTAAGADLTAPASASRSGTGGLAGLAALADTAGDSPWVVGLLAMEGAPSASRLPPLRAPADFGTSFGCCGATLYARVTWLSDSDAGAATDDGCEAAGAGSGAFTAMVIRFAGLDSDPRSATIPATINTTATAGAHTHHSLHRLRRGVAMADLPGLTCPAPIAAAVKASRGTWDAAAVVTSSRSAPIGRSTALPDRNRTSRQSAHCARWTVTRWLSLCGRLYSANAVSVSAEG